MTAMLLAYVAASYTFSGLICYLAHRKDFNPLQESQLRGNSTRFVAAGITLLWPIWLIAKIYGRRNKTSKRAATLSDRINNGSSNRFWMP
ncbi:MULTISPECIES: hypothetical protein [Aerosakkonema]|uniref:hypothetical protein n=1 Tax=Aerosakkonema TaxID=1246629 RepID=UPI0035B86A3F